MSDFIKIEGRLEALEIHNEMMGTMGSGRDSQIMSSALLAGATESLSLSAQTLFVASQSRLHVQCIVAKIDDKICVGQFHRALLEENEQVVCAARPVEGNLYELYAILSPKSGLLHMPVGMGASKKTYTASAMKGARLIFLGTAIGMILLFIFMIDFDKEIFIIWFGVLFLFYFVIIFIMKGVIRSLLHLSEKSEQVFEVLGFKNPEEVFLLPSRLLSEKHSLLLESVFEYRNIIQDDPYPKDYFDKKN
ncbi:putative type VI secretion system effector [Acinetobacter shaoyimingii]|uniref:Uncharacterized protein n=1 Tax=Acinetobacter shaoyimingii TaxID=2715164 RepID=A0A6G8RY88_9GAMM|nr:putative type VI secretion system effector [Acinetobacter shaoyimingii]QIO06899.1 hypothetical protein G8E00_13580 [Acinetobacter shaoyimingii]